MSTKNPSNNPPYVRQAGGVVFRAEHGCLEILLVRPRDGEAAWVFPKGHVEPGEADHETALREVCEEAGINGRLVGAVDDVARFDSKGEPVEVRYFVIEAVAAVTPSERRTQAWLPAPVASKLLTHEESREILSAAIMTIENHLLGTGRGDSAFREFLLHELAHTEDSLIKSEEDGERRVTTFVTLAAAVGSVLAFVMDKDAGYVPQAVAWPVVLALGALFILGYFTLVRVVTRNRASDQYKHKLARLRRCFMPSASDPRRTWLPFDPFHVEQRKELSFLKPSTGGWLEVLLLVEAFLGGGLIAALVPTPDWMRESLVAVAGAVISWVSLVAFARRLMGPSSAERHHDRA